MGPYLIFRTGYPLLYRKQHLRTDVCQNGCTQWRHGAIYQPAVSAMDYQTLLESVCRHYQNQKMVGSFHADSYVDSFHPADPDHSASGRSDHGSGHDSYQYVHRNLDTVYHHGIRFRHTRYCRRRVLYAGIEIGRAG